jgi:3-isopropylmalate/(R)-2-methylmalate dehydratase small subunit
MNGGSEPRTRAVVEGHGIPLTGDDIDTDRIIPARFAKVPTFDGLGAGLFADDRSAARAQGQTHPLDDPCHAGAAIAFVKKNFGCGSSREHAVAALMRWQHGIRALVGESFAEIFLGNCVANGVPAATASAGGIGLLMETARAHPQACFRLDLHSMTVTGPGIPAVAVTMPADARHRLISGGWDTLAHLLAAAPHVRATAAAIPYLAGFAVTGRQGPGPSRIS